MELVFLIEDTYLAEHSVCVDLYVFFGGLSKCAEFGDLVAFVFKKNPEFGRGELKFFCVKQVLHYFNAKVLQDGVEATTGKPKNLFLVGNTAFEVEFDFFRAECLQPVAY